MQKKIDSGYFMGQCFCKNVDFGTYDHVVGMKTPFENSWSSEVVPIDVCIATEIAELWHIGIKTLNSCCGHGKAKSSVVVDPKFEKPMTELGYRPGMELLNGLPTFYLRTGTQHRSTAWRTHDNNSFVEVVPIDDKRMHLVGDECWCGPKTTRESNARPVISHRARDGRKTQHERT